MSNSLDQENGRVALIATLLPNPLSAMRLRTALRDRYTLRSCESLAELLDVCGTSAVSTVVVDPYDSRSHAPDFEPLRQLKRRYPSVSIVLYVSLPPATAQHMFEMGRLGLDALVVSDQDDSPTHLLARIEQSGARALADSVRSALGDLRPTARDAVLTVVARAHERLSPESLARLLGIRRKLLAERLAEAGFPSPQPLIAWGRLIVAARMLEDEQRSADSVALALEFPSGSAFRNTCQRYLRLAPQQIRASGGAAYVIQAFLEHRRDGAGAAIEELEDDALGEALVDEGLVRPTGTG
ncbi:MAG TPA: AraC family transcriptional regulator [Gemmatimonadaceae bacterium]|nr:AraC family transcriptional regulator [Gemmatimonadaceae bacterium]